MASFGFQEAATFSAETRSKALGLLSQHPHLTSQMVSRNLKISLKNATDLLQTLVKEGQLKPLDLKGSPSYGPTDFEHATSDVQEELFESVLRLTQGGVAHTPHSIQKQLHVPIRVAKATLEEMRKRKLLQGTFYGNLCVYRNGDRTVTRQGDSEEIMPYLTPPSVPQDPAVVKGRSNPNLYRVI